RRSEIVDEIGKLLYQVIRKSRPRLKGSKLLPFLLSQALNDERDSFDSPLRDSLGSRSDIQRLHGVLKNLVQFLQLLPKHVTCRTRLVGHLFSPVYLVCLVYLVHLVYLVRSKLGPDRLNRPDRPRQTLHRRFLANLAASLIASIRLPGSAMPFPTISNAVP